MRVFSLLDKKLVKIYFLVLTSIIMCKYWEIVCFWTKDFLIVSQVNFFGIKLFSKLCQKIFRICNNLPPKIFFYISFSPVSFGFGFYLTSVWPLMVFSAAGERAAFQNVCLSLGYISDAKYPFPRKTNVLLQRWMELGCYSE